MLVEIILSSIDVFIVSISILICIGIIFLILCRVQPLFGKISILLICNTYLSMLFTNVMMLTLFTYNIYGHLYLPKSLDDAWCDIRAYFAYTGYFNFYYSFLLQASFRLFRVVFYKHKRLQSQQFFFVAIILQWIFSFVLDLANLLSNDYTYIPFRYKCWMTFQTIRGLAIAFLLIYVIPLVMVMVIYIYIIRYIRQTNHLQQRRRLSNKRDMSILKRILIVLFVNVGIGVPTLIILFDYIFTGYVIPYAYDIQDLSVAIGLLAASVCFTATTPEIRKLLHKNQQQIRPTATMRHNQRDTTQTVQQAMEESK